MGGGRGEESEMGQLQDPDVTLRAFEQILPELKKLSQQELNPEEIRVELEKVSKSDLQEQYLKLLLQHQDVIRALVVLVEAKGEVQISDDRTAG
jgi:hypothetical protein